MTTENSYATDGRCHNANRGTYGHECGKPATWLSESASGFSSGFCDRCKKDGDEARGRTGWRKHPRLDALPVDVSTIYEYGLTQKLSNSIRCF